MIIEKLRDFARETNYSTCQLQMKEIGEAIYLNNPKYTFNKCGASQMPIPRYFSFHNTDYYLGHVPGCRNRINIGASRGYYIVYLFNIECSKVYLSLAQATKGKSEAEVGTDTQNHRLLLNNRNFDHTKILEGIIGKLQVNSNPSITPNHNQVHQANMYELSTMFAIEYDLSQNITDETFIADFNLFDQLYDWLIDDLVQGAHQIEVEFDKIKDFFINYGGTQYKKSNLLAKDSGKSAIQEFKKITRFYSGAIDSDFVSDLETDFQGGAYRSACKNYFWNRYFLKDANVKTCLIFSAGLDNGNLSLKCALSLEFKDATNNDYVLHNKMIHDVKLKDETKAVLHHNNSGNGYDEFVIDIDGPLIPSRTAEIISNISDSITELKDYMKKTLNYGRGKSMIETKIKELLSDGDVKQIIFTGAPGTGKTFVAKRIANQLGSPLLWKKDANIKYEFVQFHPSYDYTDFVEGLRPVYNTTDGSIKFAKIDGIFKKFCRNVVELNKTAENKYNKYYFIIDEINRADLSKVFGELMFCLEKDKRGAANIIQTQYQNIPTYDVPNDCFEDGFYIPENVIIIGTMNDIDRSVESMDFALRRRFEWLEFIVDDSMLKDAFISIDSFMNPVYGKIIKNNADVLSERIMNLNSIIYSDVNNSDKFGLNKHYYISQGQFSNIPNIDSFNDLDSLLEYVWNYRIKTLLKEYLRGENEKDIDEFLNACYNALFGAGE